VLLRPVEGAVGEADELVAAVSLNGERGEAGTDGDAADVAELRGSHALDDRLRCRKRKRLVVIDEQKRELVTAEAKRLTALAQARCDLREHAVARRMAEAVVDLLEVVDVDEAQRQRSSLSLRVAQLALKTLVKVAVIAQTGERIGEGETHRAQRAVRRPLVEGDCEQRSHERDGKHGRSLPQHNEHQRGRSHEGEGHDCRPDVRSHQLQVRLAGAERDCRRDQHDVHHVVGGGREDDRGRDGADAVAVDRRDQRTRRESDECEDRDVEGDALEWAMLGELDDRRRCQKQERAGGPAEEDNRSN
jgi:hypothetical protein